MQDMTIAQGVADYRAQVERLKALAVQMPQLAVELQHHFANGMYARTAIIPADRVLLGAEHNTDHLCVINGDAEVLTETGPVRVTGQHVLVGRAGIQRAVYTHAPTTWTTICRTDATTVHEAEDALVQQPESLQTRNPTIDCAAAASLEN
jgi:hypothetical protein